MLTAEELRISTNKKGFQVYTWHKKFERNEALDVRCYARAAAYVIGIDRFKNEHYEAMRSNAIRSQETSTVTAPVKKRSSYWDKK